MLSCADISAFGVKRVNVVRSYRLVRNGEKNTTSISTKSCLVRVIFYSISPHFTRCNKPIKGKEASKRNRFKPGRHPSLIQFVAFVKHFCIFPDCENKTSFCVFFF